MSTRCTEHKARGRGSMCGKTPQADDGRNIAKCGKHRKCHNRLGTGRYCENYTIGSSQLCKGCQLAADANALSLEVVSEDLRASLNQWNGFQPGRTEGSSSVKQQQQQQQQRSILQPIQLITSSEEQQHARDFAPIQPTSLADRMAHLTGQDLADLIPPHILVDDSASSGSDEESDGDMPIPTRKRPLQKATKPRVGGSIPPPKDKPTAIMNPATDNHQQHPPRLQAPPPPLRELISGASERIRRFSGEKMAGISSRFAHARRQSPRRGHRGSSSNSSSSSNNSSNDDDEIKRPNPGTKKKIPGVPKKKQHQPTPAAASFKGNANRSNKDFTVQRALNVDMDALLRANMQPLEMRIHELQASLPTATDFGTLLASLDALTAVLWAVYDRDGKYDNRAPTAAKKGSALPRGGRDDVGRVGEAQEGVGDGMVNGLLSSWDGDEVQRSGWGKGKGREAAVEEGDLLIE